MAVTQNQPPGTPRARIPGPQQPPPPYSRIPAGLWKRCLGIGLAVWALTAAVTYATADVTPLPTLILLGGFLVPVSFVLWAYERHGRDLGTSAVLGCFLAGGALGVLGASVTEYQLTRPSLWMYVGTGLTEEAVKLGALMFLLRRHTRIRGPRAGLVLGATLGFGFAALESAGHAFDAAVSLQGVGLRTLLETEILRGVLTPFGPGLWTAVTGAALLARRRADGRFRLTARLAERLPRRLPAARAVGLHARDRAVASGPAHPRRTRRNAFRPGQAAAVHRRAGPPLHPVLGGRPVPRRDRGAGLGALAGAPRRRLEKYPLGV